MTQVTVNSNSYSDAGETAKDMRNGGFRSYLLQMISDLMVEINGLQSGVSLTNPPVIVTGTGAQAVNPADNMTVWNPASPADTTFTLPASPANGEVHRFKNRQSAGALFVMTVAGAGGNTIDGAASITVPPGGSVRELTYSSTLTDWVVS